MPVVTRAVVKAFLGPAQPPSTIYTSYKDIVSMVEGGLPSSRGKRVPKRAREEEPYFDHQEFVEWMENPIVEEESNAREEISSREISPAMVEEILREKAEEWCAFHQADSCSDSGCMGSWQIFPKSKKAEDLAHMWVNQVTKAHPEPHFQCPMCNSSFRSCLGECWKNPVPPEILALMSPKKQLNLWMETLQEICKICVWHPDDE
jgi:hypothetical protein